MPLRKREKVQKVLRKVIRLPIKGLIIRKGQINAGF